MLVTFWLGQEIFSLSIFFSIIIFLKEEKNIFKSYAFGLFINTFVFAICDLVFYAAWTKVPDTSEEEEEPTDAFYQQALAGFILVLNEEGDMVFLSENVNKFIGITQVCAALKVLIPLWRMNSVYNAIVRSIHFGIKISFFGISPPYTTTLKWGT